MIKHNLFIEYITLHSKHDITKKVTGPFQKLINEKIILIVRNLESKIIDLIIAVDEKERRLG